MAKPIRGGLSLMVRVREEEVDDGVLAVVACMLCGLGSTWEQLAFCLTFVPVAKCEECCELRLGGGGY